MFASSSLRKRVSIASLAMSALAVVISAGCAAARPPVTAKPEKASLLGTPYPITLAGKRSGEGYFNADATKMIFQSERDPQNPFYQMFVLDRTSGTTELVSTGQGKTTCGWFAPHADAVMFSSTHEDPAAAKKQKAELELRASGKTRRYAWDYDEHYEIYARDLNSKKLTRLTKTVGYDAEGSFSPDGKKILFASNREAYNHKLSAEERHRLETNPASFIELYVMNADGSDVRRLTNNDVYDGGPFYSADGLNILWRRFSPDGATAEVFTANADGTNPRQLTSLGALSWAPFFHPSGDYVIFTTNLHGFDNFELYMVSTKGGSAPVRVTETPGFDGLPVFTADGQTLTWSTKRGPDSTVQIYAADWNDSAARVALNLPPSPKSSVGAAASASVDPKLREHMQVLTSDAFDGRLTGTDGERLATDYAASQLQSMGFAPYGESKTFFENFEFTAGVDIGEPNTLTANVQGSTSNLKVRSDWVPISFSENQTVNPAEVVFAGYGITAPATTGTNGVNVEEYDSYVHLDVKNKWVLVFRDLPVDLPEAARHALQQYSSMRFKAMLARSNGALGILFVSGPLSKYKNQLVPLAFDSSQADSDIAVASITDALANSLLAPSNKTVAQLQGQLRGGSLIPGFKLQEVTLGATITVAFERKTGRNVLAVLRGGAADSGPPLVIGAHIDHLGHGTGGSLAREAERGQMHRGADDNASGVSAILEIARAVSGDTALRSAMKRDLVVALWSGEELGLLGSSHHMEQFNKVASAKHGQSAAAAAYLNLDMVGRAKDGALVVQGIGSGDSWLPRLERANAPVRLAITTQNDSYLPTDATSFYLAGIPILSGYTGAHEDYHSPRDTEDKINYADLSRITELFERLTRELLETGAPPSYQKMQKPEHLGQRANLRAYLGSIPDYAAGDTAGLKLSGVTSGAPADKAGLKSGDIIVELGGKKIANIYDYTFAIEALEVGKTVEIVVIRDGATLKLSITPGSRE